MLPHSKLRRLTNSIEYNCSINKNAMRTRVPCNSTPCLCCQQLFSTATIKSNETNKTFKIYHRVNCKGSCVVCLLECYTCNIQYVGKSETPFNLRINNLRQDVKNPDAIPACEHFNRHDLEFNNHGRIIITEQLRDISTTSAETLRKTKTARKIFDDETWDFSANWSQPRPKLNRFLADFPFTSINFRFCMSVVKWRQISFSTWKSQIRHIRWERPWLKLIGKNSLFLLVLSPFHLVPYIYIVRTMSTGGES